MLQPDGSSRAPELREANTEQDRIFEFYANLFESMPDDDDDENATSLVDRFKGSPALLGGIPLGRVLEFPESQFNANREPLVQALVEDNADVGHQLEVASYWFRLKEIAEIVKGKMARGEI